MSRFGPSYVAASRLQRVVLSRVMSEDCAAEIVPRLAEAWRELEVFKREIRGIPRLKAASVGELALPWKRARQITAPAAPAIDLEPAKVPEPTLDPAK